MARRKDSNAEGLLILLGGIGALIFYLYDNLPKWIHTYPELATLVFFFFFFSVICIIILRKRINAKSEKIALQIIYQHQKTLGVECLRKLKIDSYGTEEPEKWYKEVRYFFDTQLSFLPHYKYSKFRTNCYGIINKIGRDEREKLLNNEKKYSDSSFLSIGDPSSFKYYCGNILEKQNWHVSFHEDIVDFIATKNNIKIVAICKFYQRSIDKNAVQQASLAKSHYNADIAIVIANQDYSEGAKHLAHLSKVHLLDYRQLFAHINSL